MHSFLSRANQLLSYIGYSLGALAIFAALTNFFLNPKSFKGKFEIVSVKVRNAHNPSISRSIIHAADFKFNMNIDFSPSFHWNVKEIYIRMIAFYSTPKNPKNEVTVWDYIILKHDNSHIIDLTNKRTKYTLEDDGTNLLNNVIDFKIEIEMIPYVGLISSVTFPQEPRVKMPNEFTGAEYVKV